MQASSKTNNNKLKKTPKQQTNKKLRKKFISKCLKLFVSSNKYSALCHLPFLFVTLDMSCYRL